MKVKLKFDKDALLGGLIAHGEKIGFGLFLLLFLLLCIGVLQQKPYDKTPQKFKDEAVRVEGLLAGGPPPLEELGITQPTEVVVHPIPAEPYAGPWIVNRPPSETGNQRRGEPKFFTVRDLHVGTEYGAVALSNKPAAVDGAPNAQPVAPLAPPGPPRVGAKPGADTKIEGKQWAVITGVIPGPQQAQEYRTTFAIAPKPRRDLPRWDSFEIERQEGEGPWTPLDLKAMAAEEATHAAGAPDSPDLKNQLVLWNLCRPLPAMVNKDHDPSAVHPAILAQAAPKSLVQPVNNPGALPPVRKQSDLPSEYVTDQMFRCFDYTVQPGKTYRYRVRLALANPNYGLQRYEVVDGKLLTGATRLTEWSEPSPPVNVPRASSMLAGAVERARGATGESKSEVIVRMWDQARAVDALAPEKLMRGQMANYSKVTYVKNPLTGAVEEMPVNFLTNSVMLDLTGGDALPVYRGRAPGRMLVLSPGGELDVKSELADLETYNSELGRIYDLRDEAKPDEPPPPPPPPDDNRGKKGRGKER